MSKQPTRDERQTDLFGVPIPPAPATAKPARTRAGSQAEPTEASDESPVEARPPRTRRKRAAGPAEDAAQATPNAAEPAPPVLVPEPESLATLAERAGRAELDELVSALSDEGLAHLALASARALKRRIARGEGRRGQGGAAKGRAGPLERAVQSLAAEMAGPPDDSAW